MAIAPSLPEFPTTLGPPPTFADRPVLRFSVEQYHQMIAAGVFPDGLRAELIEGVIVHMTPIGPPHYCVQALVDAAFRRMIEGQECYSGLRHPITMADSEPEPDVAIIRGGLRDYAKRHPSPEEVALVVEVADSSLAFDRGPKARLYAAAGIPEYWIVNLIDRQVEVHGEPASDAPGTYIYQRRSVVKDEVEFILEGRRLGHIRLADILP